MAEQDASQADEAMLELISRPSQAHALFARRLTPVAAIESATIDAYIHRLDSDDYSTRVSASNALSGFGESIISQLELAMRLAGSAEARRRMQRLLEALESRPIDGETLRAIRVIEILERIGTESSYEIIGQVASGAKGARITRAAEEILKRRCFGS